MIHAGGGRGLQVPETWVSMVKSAPGSDETVPVTLPPVSSQPKNTSGTTCTSWTSGSENRSGRSDCRICET